MWGNPSRPQGYRTAWYKFVPPISGIVTIHTKGSTYDTVLAVYAGSCGALTQLACNDDASASGNYVFSSEVEVSVIQGGTYYVEVGDWRLAQNGPSLLALSAYITAESEWRFVSTMDEARTRHAAVVNGVAIYVIGGQTFVGNTPVRTPRTSVYNTETNTWTMLSPMYAADGFGYSNTTAALVNGKIYLPSGYVGDDDTYDGTHWVYDIATNIWSTTTPAPWPNGQPMAYSYAVSYDATVTDDRYFLTGGLSGPFLSGDTVPHREVFSFVPASNIWIPLAQMQVARYAHVAALQRINGQDHLCVVGGLSKNAINENIVLSGGECYNILTNQWNVTTGAMNFPRFNAASAVGSDGRWYVYGGTDFAFRSVAVTEVYNPATNSWTALDSRFDLQTINPKELDRPARAWPRAGFAGDSLWAIGGHRNTAGGDIVLNLVERLLLAGGKIYVPISLSWTGNSEPDDSFATAHGLPPNLGLFFNFEDIDDYYDAFFFYVTAPSTVHVLLSNIPANSDYNVHVYTANKVYLASGLNVGNNDEHLVIPNVNPGLYYLFVQRAVPTDDPSPQYYRLEIQY
jgi:N-acetylneuraminic acid mutarotase